MYLTTTASMSFDLIKSNLLLISNFNINRVLSKRARRLKSVKENTLDAPPASENYMHNSRIHE